MRRSVRRAPRSALLRRPVVFPQPAAHLMVGRVAGLALRPRRAASDPEADPLAMPSAQASWSAQPQVEAWSADRCVAGCWLEVRRRVECCRPMKVGALSAEPLASGVQVQPRAVAALAGAELLAQQSVVAAVAGVPSVQPVEVAAEVAELLAPQPVAVVAEERASPPVVVAEEERASLQAVAAVEEERALPPVVVVVVEERALLQAAAGEAAQPALRAAVARPSAALSAFHPGRVLPWPAPPRAARFAHAMPCSQIAPPTARWWPAARGEVWSC